MKFTQILLVTCLFMLSLVFMSNDYKHNQSQIHVKDTTCKEVVIIDHYPYMVINGVQHSIIHLENRESFHRHFMYFYNMGWHPRLDVYYIEEDSDILILECNNKFYY